MNSGRPPVIIIGMHRSGTSMLTDILETLGLFMGKKKNANQEAWFFYHLNVWLLRQSGGEWNHPEPFDHVLNDPVISAHFRDFLRFVLTTPRAVNYLGWSGYLRYRTPARLEIAWGWKDPRNTFTLPLWLDLFPEARVIHIYRNGVDVASSLRTRGQKGIARFLRWRRWERRLAFSWWNQLSPKYYVRNMTLEQGFALWETYTQRADEHIAALPEQRTMVIKYEDFLESPFSIMRELCDFVGVAAQDDRIKKATSGINPSRSRAYEHDEELRRFYDTVANTPQMLRYGY